MSHRAVAVLDRFPQHLAAAEGGKRFGRVVVVLADDVDVLAAQLQTVRASRRIAEAPTRRDLLALAALHRLGDAALAPLAGRLAAVRAAAGDAAAYPPVPADLPLLAQLTGLDEEVLATLGDDVVDAAGASGRHRARLQRERDVLLGIIGAHIVGNATPTSLLHAAAAYLGLGVEQVRHEPGGWWHVATCRDRVRLVPPPAPPGAPAQEPPDLTPRADLLALEENPFRPADVGPTPMRHGQRMLLLRGGMGEVSVTVRVVGVGARTVRPMVVHLGASRGVVYEGEVPDGVELAFRSTGRVTLGATDVTGSAWAFSGAVFADETQILSLDDRVLTLPDGTTPDGVPAGLAARFATTTPIADALDPTPSLPHGAAAVGPLDLPRGESRWAALVRVARAGGVQGGAAVPRIDAGRFDQGVFGDEPAIPAAAKVVGAGSDPSLRLGFAWEEREPFAVRVLLPQRLSAADDDAGTLVRQPLARLLDRHRAAGVAVRVEYADPRWTLGQGVMRERDEESIGGVLAGTQLWPDGTAPPG
jgi:hypothetical protein